MPVGLYAGANVSIGNAVTVIFPYNFKILDQTHIEVKVDGVLKALGGDYTVSGVGNSAGGNVTFLVAPANLAIVQRARKVPYKRDTNYPANGDFKEATVDADFDGEEMQIQQIAADVIRAFKAPLSVTTDQVISDASWLTRVGTVFGFDALGNFALLVGQAGTSLVSLAAAAGSSMVGFIQAGVGAVLRTVESILLETARASDFGFSTAGTAAANKLALQATIDSLGTARGGIVVLQRGQFLCSAGIVITAQSIKLRGQGGYGYSSGNPGTQLVMGAGTFGIDVTQAGVILAQDRSCEISGIAIDGAGLLTNGIGFKGHAILEDLEVKGCVNAAFYGVDFVNQSHIDKVLGYGSGFGFLMQGANTTTFSVKRSNFRVNTVGVRFEAGVNVDIENVVSESNTGEGLQMYKATGQNMSQFTFKGGFWLENNNAGTSNYNMSIDSQTHDFTNGPISSISFENLQINATGTTRHMNVVSSRFLKLEQASALGGDQVNGVQLGAWCNFSTFLDFNGSAITDAGFNYRVTTQQANLALGTTCGPVWPGTIYPGQVKFPAFASIVATTEPNTVNYFEYNTWTPTDASGAGLALTINGTPRFQRFGRHITAWASVTYPGTANGANSLIGGLPYTSENNASIQGGARPLTTEATLAVLRVVQNTKTIQPFTNVGGFITNATLSTDLVDLCVTYLVP